MAGVVRDRSRFAAAGALTLGAVFCLTLPALADGRFDRVRAAFVQWADANAVTNASLVLVEDGTIAGRYDRGSYTTATPEPVASESKLITGLCIIRTIETGKLKFSSTLGDVLGEEVAGAADPRIRSITVAQLLTHSSGITYDPSQGSDIEQFAPFTQRSEAAQVKAALSRPLGSPPGKSYFYNNENYAALGLVIEAVTGEDYVAYCNRAVLEPAGITDASLNPDWMVMGTYGGWLISAEDYARLLGYLAPHRALLRIPPGKWPKFALGGGASYSVGATVRKNGSWFNFWHFGSWQYGNADTSASFGAYFADWGGNLAVFADYSPTVPGDEQNALDAAMVDAALR